eukprot:TRINITY_DN10763_c0_g3_i2.p1 TRINITY_DN10763_c0_g3~~TRINITY_DN10763_c0_g3_i2.p1  ORF type:complete len:356 (+),score=26.49 TRINITY_DN10763_c0_g3_i2:89-1156(+)
MAAPRAKMQQVWKPTSVQILVAICVFACSLSIRRDSGSEDEFEDSDAGGVISVGNLASRGAAARSNRTAQLDRSLFAKGGHAGHHGGHHHHHGGGHPGGGGSQHGVQHTGGPSTFRGREVWKDDFNGHGLPDRGKWNFVYDKYPPNREKQAYMGANAKTVNVSGGTLKIYARHDRSGGRTYTSARITSKQSWLYGKFSARIRMNRCGARGTWPAFWMLPTDSAYGKWPRSGEIDIMEMVGYHNSTVHFTVHTEHRNGMPSTPKQVTSSSWFNINAWNVFAAEWRHNGIKMFLNGKQVYHYQNRGGGHRDWPFNKRFHFVLNVAVGGDWGGIKGIDDNRFRGQGQFMEVDWVKVEQ